MPEMPESSTQDLAISSANELLPSLADENIETLRNGGELGRMFAGLYKAVVAEDPRLAAVKIWAIGPDAPGFGFLKYTGGSVIHKDDRESGRYELVMNTKDGVGHFQRLLATRRVSAEVTAKKIGIESGRMTPEQLATFIFLHELGHIVDFMDNAPDKATHDKRRERDMATLPIPGYDPAKLAAVMDTPEGKKWFFNNLKTLHANFAVSSFADLLKVQEEAYRGMETEDIPDRFAARVMNKHGLV